ncbi:MAG: large conductance mechanosensitive channel protein MscL [Coriobacteriia bacterium]|nr:large conductance mechanosensitive channel protein MscL [Coriobacteriia bacterium]
MVKLVKEFKEFIGRGNVIELAAAVVMGAAFNAIVTSVVNDLIMPLLSVFTGGIDFSALYISISPDPDAARLAYGNLIAAVIHFLIVALVLFIAIKAYNKLTNKKTEEKTPDRKCPFCFMAIHEKASRCPHCTSELDSLEE